MAPSGYINHFEIVHLDGTQSYCAGTFYDAHQLCIGTDKRPLVVKLETENRSGEVVGTGLVVNSNFELPSATVLSRALDMARLERLHNTSPSNSRR